MTSTEKHACHFFYATHQIWICQLHIQARLNCIKPENLMLSIKNKGISYREKQKKKSVEVSAFVAKLYRTKTCQFGGVLKPSATNNLYSLTIAFASIRKTSISHKTQRKL